MLNCEAVTELCSEEMERPLRLGEKVSLGTHLMVCARCAHFRRQMKTLRQVMQTYAEGRAAGSIPDEAEHGG
jgi:hypothetical protein